MGVDGKRKQMQHRPTSFSLHVILLHLKGWRKSTYEDGGRCGDLSGGGIVANTNKCGLVVHRYCLRSSIWVAGKWGGSEA